MASLFEEIYLTGTIPEPWKVSKIVPILKREVRLKLRIIKRSNSHLSFAKSLTGSDQGIDRSLRIANTTDRKIYKINNIIILYKIVPLKSIKALTGRIHQMQNAN